MAEHVQRKIEEMLPELEEMKRIELFSEKETRTIVKRRQAFEYKLCRTTRQKEDYLHYIQYEINLLALIKRRRNTSTYKFKLREIDVPIIRRIISIFKVACERFKDDVNLWLSHLDFMKRRKTKTEASHVYLKMLQIHNKKPGLWVLAAQHELEECLSMETARVMLQRGIRHNPTSEQLWQEYFRMELLNADKLRKRHEILGVASLAPDEANLPKEVLEGKVALVVFKKAVESFPGNADFCLSFLPICQLFDFTKEIEEEIFNSLKLQYASCEVTWEATAIRCLQKAAHCDESIARKEREELQWQCELDAADVFDEGVQEVNTKKMWNLYIKFCKSQLKQKASKKLCDKRVQLLLMVFQRAGDDNKLSAELYEDWVDTLCHVGEIVQLQDVLSQALTHHAHSPSLWVAKLRVAMATNQPVDQVKVEVEKALEKVKEKESYPVWQMSLSWAKQHSPQYAESLFERGILTGEEVSIPLRVDYLDWTFIINNLKAVRKLYKRLAGTKPLSLKFFQAYIDIEKAQPFPKIRRIRAAYEDAIREFGETNTDVWLDYIRMELSHADGRPQEAGQIYWRALKQVEGSLTERFVTSYTLMQNGHL